jgi:hypothetical protein
MGDNEKTEGGKGGKIIVGSMQLAISILQIPVFANCLLPIAFCQLPIANCSLPTANFHKINTKH